MTRKKYIFLLLSLMSIAVASVLFIYKYSNYAKYALIATFIFIILYFISLLMSKNEDIVYKENIKYIFKVYDEILIKSEKMPEMNRRDIVILNKIEDLVKAQKEIRKPIYYYKDLSSYTFILLDKKEALIYVVKKNNNVITEIDSIINLRLSKKEVRAKKESAKKEEYKIFEGLERTTIIKVGDMSYNISPIRDVELPTIKKRKKK